MEEQTGSMEQQTAKGERFLDKTLFAGRIVLGCWKNCVSSFVLLVCNKREESFGMYDTS